MIPICGSNALIVGHLSLFGVHARPRVRHAIRNSEEIFLNSIVIGELTAGFIRGKQRRKNEAELQRFFASPRVGLLSITEGTAERYAAILNGLWQAGTPIPTNDIWIAASAMEYGLSVLTTDQHYQKVPQVIVEYFPVN